MKPITGTLRITACLLFAFLAAAGLSACGGGSGSGSGGAAPAAVSVSIAPAAGFPAGATLSAPSSSLAVAAAVVTPEFDNLLVSVTRLALIPSSGEHFPDGNGQLEEQDSPGERSGSGMPGFATADLDEPLVIDLLHLDGAESVLNRFTSVPAGSYTKIRVYYDNVVGRKAGQDDVLFHPTAHYHFDVHFVGGKLVVPQATDPEGGIRFYSVVIRVVGLKYHESSPGNFLLRPQLFAEAVGEPKYLVRGVAENVDPDGTFDVATAGGDVIAAEHGSGTGWRFKDGRTTDPVADGAAALRDTALVDVIGTFSGGVLVAEEVDITFPGRKTGRVDAGWGADNTFTLRLASDNVVYPMPDRSGAYYDNYAWPYDRLTDAAVAADTNVKARGYLVDGGIEAFWISVLPPVNI